MAERRDRMEVSSSLLLRSFPVANSGVMVEAEEDWTTNADGANGANASMEAPRKAAASNFINAIVDQVFVTFIEDAESNGVRNMGCFCLPFCLRMSVK